MTTPYEIGTCSYVPIETREGEGLGLIVLHLVDRPDDLDDAAKLLKVCLEVLLGEGLARGKLANVHLALARLSFLAGHLGQEVKIIASKIIFPRKVQHVTD